MPGWRNTYSDVSIGRSSRYRINENGGIEELPGFNFSVTAQQQNNSNYTNEIKNAKNMADQFDSNARAYPYSSLTEATNAATKKQADVTAGLRAQYEEQLSKDRTYTAIADQIAGLAQNTSGLGALPSLNPQPVSPAAAQGATLPTFGLGGGAPPAMPPAPSKPTAQQIAANITGSLGSLSAFNNYGASDLSSRLNFQVSDQQILDDYNTAYSQRLARIAEQGASQITGIQQRLDAATRLLAGLPANDPRRTTSDQYIAELRNDLASVQSAVSQATKAQADFKPLTTADAAGQRQVSQFREFLKMPEERSLDQIRQIDPATFSAAQSLTNQYQNLMGQTYESTLDPATQAARRATQDAFLRRANEDYGSSIDPNTLNFRRQVEQQIQGKVNEDIPSFLNPQTEAFRGTLEDDTLNQLRLGSLLDSDLQRQYQQAPRRPDRQGQHLRGGPGRRGSRADRGGRGGPQGAAAGGGAVLPPERPDPVRRHGAGPPVDRGHPAKPPRRCGQLLQQRPERRGCPFSRPPAPRHHEPDAGHGPGQLFGQRGHRRGRGAARPQFPKPAKAQQPGRGRKLPSRRTQPVQPSQRPHWPAKRGLPELRQRQPGQHRPVQPVRQPSSILSDDQSADSCGSHPDGGKHL